MNAALNNIEFGLDTLNETDDALRIWEEYIESQNIPQEWLKKNDRTLIDFFRTLNINVIEEWGDNSAVRVKVAYTRLRIRHKDGESLKIPFEDIQLAYAVLFNQDNRGVYLAAFSKFTNLFVRS